MFQAPAQKNSIGTAVSIVELIYHGTVRQLRKSHGNAVIGLLMNIVQSVLFVAGFYAMFVILGIKSAALRGDFVLYIMSGVFLFMTHTKAMGAVAGSEGPASAMMQHTPMNTAIAIMSAALSSLYIQVLSVCVILFVYHTFSGGFVIEQPVAALGILLLAWCTGVAVGIDISGRQALVSGFRRGRNNRLCPRQHDRLWQDVRRQYPAAINAGDVRLEPAVSLHRSNARRGLHQLLAAQFVDLLSNLCITRSGHDRPDGRVLHPQERLAQLGCAALIHNSQRQVDPPAAPEKLRGSKTDAVDAMMHQSRFTT